MRCSLSIILLTILILVSWSASPALAQQGGTYVVQPGDTLLSIAARYGVPVSQLAAANGLSWNSWVYVGQTLVIPSNTGSPGLPNLPNGGVYVVQPGDTLSSIAVRHGTTIDALQKANALTNTNFIYVGQRLIIPGNPQVPVAPPVPRPAPQPAPDPGSKWIDVNLSTQTLVAYSGNTPVFSARVSTGLPATPTVVGTFRIYVKYTSAPMQGPDYYLPNVPYVMYFYRGYSLHGTYWHNNFGTPMSHGCVNLATPDAEWLFNWAEVGTKVVTHY